MKSFKDHFNIAKVLASLFTHSAIPEEEKTYRAWLEESLEHQELAERILNKETYERNNRLMKDFPSQQGWEKIYPHLGEGKSSSFFSLKRSLKYAALILLLLLPTSYIIYNWAVAEPISEITPGKRGGEVTLSNGNTLTIPDGIVPEGATEIFIIDSKGINYQTPTNKPQVKEITNTLRTLHGMECHIILSDGTKVHLNAESKLTYPICFGNKERIVQVEGEAYFDVAPDKKHPFIVQTPLTTIKVTGTSFNVRSYADEQMESITLISGSVKITNRNEEFELIPNQHFVHDNNSRECTVDSVNTELYTSWETGSFIFKNVSLENVMSYLCKWYGFKYTFDDEVAKKVQIGAYLNRYANMNPIIDMIKELNMVDIKQKEGILHISHKQ